MKTIQTEKYLLLIDETAEIKEGKVLYDNTIKEIYGESITPNVTIWLRRGTDKESDIILSRDSNIEVYKTDCYKIIAASPKLGDLPEFETLPPNKEDDVKKLALIAYPKDIVETSKGCFDDLNEANRNIWIAGYKLAKSETMFSLEEVRNLKAYWFGRGILAQKENKISELKPDLSITKLKEYEFIPEIESKKVNYVTPIWSPEGSYIAKQPKIINNKIQGTWKLKTN